MAPFMSKGSLSVPSLCGVISCPHFQPAWHALAGREQRAKNAHSQAQPGCRRRTGGDAKRVTECRGAPRALDSSGEPMGIKLVIDGGGCLCAPEQLCFSVFSSTWNTKKSRGKFPRKYRVRPVLVDLMAEPAHPGKLCRGPVLRRPLSAHSPRVLHSEDCSEDSGCAGGWVLSGLS